MEAYELEASYPTGITYGSNAQHDDCGGYIEAIGADVGDLSPHDIGSLGEELAAEYLHDKGYQIVERNWTCPCGEADIVAYDDEECVLVEVKTRLLRDSSEQVWPELAVTGAKRQRYRQIAGCYMLCAGIEHVRFDVVAVSIVADGTAHMHHIECAFGREA